MNCRVALDKDPGNVRALLILGQTLLQKEHYAEAAEFLEKAISKVRFNLVVNYYIFLQFR